MKKKIYLHFSVDDVFNSLIEVTDKNIKLKDHWFFSQFYKLWKKYKISTGLYLFYEGRVKGKLRNLQEVKSIKNEMRNNWLFFGPHAYNFESPPHKFSPNIQKKHLSKVYKEIRRFTGNKCLTKKVRLHEYSESFELKKFFQKHNTTNLFTTDKSVGAHRLPKKNKKELLNFGKTTYKKLNFIRTDLRIELLAKSNKFSREKKIFEILKNRDFLTFYSHENELKKKKNRVCLINIFDFLFKNFQIISNKP